MAESESKGPLPVTLLSGFLGSGKTTLLKYILENKENLKCAVIVNDMAEINIDASLISDSGFLQQEEKLVKMQNGCICCTLREDLLDGVRKLAESQDFDYLVIESTGISEPIQVAETFAFTLDDNETPLNTVARLDTCVTVIDTANFNLDFESIEDVSERFEGATEEDERSLVDLLVDQIEFSDVILLNKVDLLTPDELQKIRVIVSKLNPGAKVFETTYSSVPLTEVINTGLFSMEKAISNPAWMRDVAENSTVLPETEEYGISSFVYTSRKPFHPERLFDFACQYFMVKDGSQEQDGEEDEECEIEDTENKIEDTENEIEGEEKVEDDSEQANEESCNREDFEKVRQKSIETLEKMKAEIGRILRSKGIVWLATKRDINIEWSQAGIILTLSPGMPWICEVEDQSWIVDEEDKERIRRLMLPEIGDRRQEIVFIGMEMKKDIIIAGLDRCLLTDEEMADSESWPSLNDPIAGEWHDVGHVHDHDHEEEEEED